MDGRGWGPSVPETREDVSLRTAVGLTATAKSDNGRLSRYRRCVQRGRIWLVDGCLSIATGRDKSSAENGNLRLKAGGHFSALSVNARYPEGGTTSGASHPRGNTV